MDSTTIIIIINFILQIFQMFDHSIMQRLKKSSCWGINFELDERKDDNKKEDKKDDNINKV